MIKYHSLMYQANFKTAIGRIYYLWKPKSSTVGGKIRIIYLGTGEKSFIAYKEKIKGLKGLLAGPEIIEKRSPEIEKKIDGYLDGGQRITDLEPEFLSGSGFEKRIWEAVQKIPFGTAISYGRLAELAGFHSAARAAGNALGKNPIIIVVPCHRVIRGNGRIGGFSSGTALKEKLLRLEKVEYKYFNRLSD